MLYVKLILSLAFVAFVAADDAETTTTLPPCAPCNRPRRDIDTDAGDDVDLGSWGRPRIPGVNVNIDGSKSDSPRQLPNPVGADEAEEIQLPSGDGSVDVDLNLPSARVPARPSGNVNIDGSGIRIPGVNVGIDVDGSGIRVPRGNGNINIDGSGIRVPRGNGNINIDGSGIRVPRGNGNINIDGSGIRIPGYGRGRGAVNIDAPSFRIPGINVGINVDKADSERLPSGGWNIDLGNIGLGNLGLGNLGIPSVSDVTGAVSGAADTARRGLSNAGKVIGHFFRGVREFSGEINQRLRDQGLSDEEIRKKFADFGAQLRLSAKNGASGENIINQINDFVVENNLQDIQEKYIRLIREQLRRGANNNGLGEFESKVEGFINSTGGFGPAVGRIEDNFNNAGGVEGIVDKVTDIAREQGPEGLDYQIRLILSQWGLADFFERISGLLRGAVRLYLNANPMIAMAMNIANSVSNLRLPLPGINLPLPGLNVVGDLIRGSLDNANSLGNSGSGSLRLPRVPRVPANFGVGGQIGERGFGVSVGTDGFQVTRAANPLLGGSLDQSPGIVGNILGTGMENAFVRTPLRVADSFLRPFQLIPGVNLARNAISASGQLAG